MLTFEEIREIITLVNQSSIQHFELEHERTKIMISQGTVTSDQRMPQQAIANTPLAVQKEPIVETVATDNKEEILHKIVSPTVGTFYSAPEPGGEPFVTIGKQVTSNTIVCVLEAMKLFNEVEAGIVGEVVEILVKEGDFIEYGQPLFLIRSEA